MLDLPSGHQWQAVKGDDTVAVSSAKYLRAAAVSKVNAAVCRLTDLITTRSCGSPTAIPRCDFTCRSGESRVLFRYQHDLWLH